MIFHSYQDWKNCIEVKCGISLTIAFVEERLSVFKDESNAEKKRFAEFYGESHCMQIASWFEQSKNEILSNY
jgi:hypothetical protein